MNKIISFTFFFALIGLGLSAQVTLDYAKMPIPGDQQFYQFSDTTGFSPGGAGTGQIWNYAGHPDSSNALTIVYSDLPSTPHNATMGPISNVAMSDGLGNWYFFDSQPAAFTQKGDLTQFSTNAPAPFSMGAVKFNFPFGFNSTNHDTVRSTYNTQVGPVQRWGYLTVTGDATGTLTLPTGVVYNNALRIRYEYFYKDSANVFGFPVLSYAFVVQYEWYAASKKLPVMVYKDAVFNVNNSDNFVKNVYYESIPVGLGGTDENISALSLYPNPTTGNSSIQFSLKQTGSVSIDILDISGRKVAGLPADIFQAGNTSIQLPVGDLPAGMYMVRLTTGETTITRKLVRY